MALALRVTTDLPSSLIFKTKKTSLLMCLNTIVKKLNLFGLRIFSDYFTRINFCEFDQTLSLAKICENRLYEALQPLKMNID